MPITAPQGAVPPHVLATQRSRRSRRRWWLLVLLLLLASAAAGGWWLWQRGNGATQTTATMTVAVVRTSFEDTVSALGRIEPRDYVDVGTQVSGQLRRIHVEPGDTVKEGDLLAEIDPTVYQARVDSDRAQLQNLAAQLRERQSRLQLSEQQLGRQQALRRQNATSDEAVQVAEADRNVLLAQIDALRAQTQQIESQLRGNQANLNYTRIYAPMAGTVASITAKQGQTLNANQSAPIVLRIADLSQMTVITQVSEADVSRLRVGQEAYFSTLGLPDKRYVGRLRQILPTPEVVNNVVLFNAIFDVPNSDGALMTQMTAQVFFVVARARNALTVPASALRPVQGRAGMAEPGAVASRNGPPQGGQQRRPGGRQGAPAAAAPQAAPGTYMVTVQKPDGSTEQREVEVGVITRVQAEIRRGLEEGELVVLGPRPAGNNAPPRPANQGPQMRPRLG
ncbi:MAG: efflux RND transporter periplasmic adaptor subunit [Alphaproteobacteria bacterium]|nr:efflux RND transporter periplasmic adaptor subunit [Alphaproteobacteria bacterium]